MKTLFVALFIVCGLSAFSQRITISGSVREAQTLEPIIGAVVTIGESSVATNNSGFYALKTDSGNQTLIASFLGYRTDTLQIRAIKDTTININLEVQATEIEQVVVVGENGSNSQFGKVSINMNQLKHTPLFMGEQDIFKYFQMLPGVVGGKEGSSELNIRGGSSDQTLIVLDDVPIYNQNHAMGFVSIFNGDALSKADLYKGSIPASMGGRLSGIAAMTTKEGNKDDHKQVLTIGTLSASFLGEGPIQKGKSSYLVSARYFTPHLLLSTAYTFIKPSPRINYLFADLTSKLTFQLGKQNTLSWNVYGGYDAFVLNMQEEGAVNNNLFSYESEAGYYWTTLASSLKLATQFSSGTFLNSMIYYTSINNRMSGKYSSEPNSILMENNLRSAINEIGFKVSASSQLAQHSINYGINGAYQFFRPKEQTYISNNENFIVANGNQNLLTTTVFFDGNLKFGKFDVHLGVRAPLYYNGHNTIVDVEPRVGASFQMTQKSSIYASFDRTTQPLFSLNRLYGGQPIDFWMPFQQKAIESANQVSAGWKYRPMNRLFFSVEGFYKDMNNLYFVSNEDMMLAGEGGYELGSGRAFGAELVGQYTAPKTTIMLSYAYTNSTRKVGNRQFDFVYDTPHNLNVYFKQLTLKRGDRSHYFSANLSFRSGMPYIITNEVYPSWDIENNGSTAIPDNPLYANVRLKNYFRLDLNYSMEKKLKKGKRVWQVSILNATNHFNPYMVVNKGTQIDAVSLIPLLPSFSYKRYF